MLLSGCRFYTLLVISTALFDKPAFKNLIVNGLVLAADGKKMSKRLKNYPDPVHVLRDYGADALRLYMINSPVVRAETLRFKEEGVKDVIKDVFLPWYNAYRFFVQNTERLQDKFGVAFQYDMRTHNDSDNIMDKWILAALHNLLKFVNDEMAGMCPTPPPFLPPPPPRVSSSRSGQARHVGRYMLCALQSTGYTRLCLAFSASSTT